MMIEKDISIYVIIHGVKRSVHIVILIATHIHNIIVISKVN